MARRRTGSIRKRAEGVFEIAVTAVRRAVDEEYDRWLRDFRMDTERGVETARRVIRLYETVRGTREDAERRVRELQFEADRGVMPGTGGTVRELLSWWLEQVVRPQRKPATWEAYRRHCRLYVGPALGDMRIKELRPHHVQTFQNELARVLAPKTVTLSRQVLNQAMEEARKNGLISENPATYRDVKGPKQRRPRVDAPAVDEVQKLLADAKRDGDRFACLYHVLAYSGLRIGEALGLTWEDVDVVGRWLLVRNPMEYTQSFGLRHGTPKSEASNRRVPLDARTVDVLMEHRAVQDARREELGARWQDVGLVFPNTTGGFMHRTQPARAMKRYGEQLRPHALRHFFATQVVERTGRIDQARDLLGHSNMATTAHFYLHPTEEGKRVAVEALADLMEVPAASIAALPQMDSLEELLSDTEAV